MSSFPCDLYTSVLHANSSRSSAANDFWGKKFLTWSGEKKPTQALAIATGCSAGATESFVVVPFELVKIKYVAFELAVLIGYSSLHCVFKRLQDKSSTYAGPMDVVRRIVKSHGVLGLYAGMEATFWR